MPAWLTAETKDQYAQVYDGFRTTPKRESTYLDDELDDYINPYSAQWYGYYASSVLSDRTFLGSTVAVVAPRTGKGEKKSLTPTARDVEALREAIGRSFMELPEGVYHRLDGVIEHLVFRDKNVLLLGHQQEAVRVFHKGQPVPALEEAREEVGREALKELALTRLIPLGGLRAAVDVEGKLCVARTPRLGAYFGFGPMPDLSGAGAGEGSKVVVQPDFSVVVIGLSTAALAELAPFCERTGRGNVGPGASVLKITRESVTRAIAQGLKPQQIVDRLTRHASHEPPANVVHEVREWGAWVKSVSTARLTVLRCPDRETADRVVGVLKRQVERLNDTTLALDAERLLPAERKKLRDNGLLVGGAAEKTSPAARKKVGARRRSY
ncbi:MAG: helicase-associated domain-containing protein [Planctomycetia bacterium]|nr:helicase-associated domain-containing protein [Planctomycetia bacterium]